MGVRFWSMTEGETRKEKAKLSEIFLSSFNDSCDDWDDINVKRRHQHHKPKQIRHHQLESCL
jgi:hypothetical protein